MPTENPTTGQPHGATGQNAASGSQYGTSSSAGATGTSSAASGGSKSEACSVLENLSARCHDSEEGYRHAARDVSDAMLAREFRELADRREEMAREIDECVRRLGGTPQTGGSTLGTAHRWWLDAKHAVGASGRRSILQEVVRGEAAFEEAYDKALRTQGIPSEFNGTLRRHHRDVRECRDRFRAMAGGGHGSENSGRWAEQGSGYAPWLTAATIGLAAIAVAGVLAAIGRRGNGENGYRGDDGGRWRSGSRDQGYPADQPSYGDHGASAYGSRYGEPGVGRSGANGGRDRNTQRDYQV